MYELYYFLQENYCKMTTRLWNNLKKNSIIKIIKSAHNLSRREKKKF